MSSHDRPSCVVCAGVIDVCTRRSTENRVLQIAPQRHRNDGADGRLGRRRDDRCEYDDGGGGHLSVHRPPVRGHQQKHVFEEQPLLRGAVLRSTRRPRHRRRRRFRPPTAAHPTAAAAAPQPPPPAATADVTGRGVPSTRR